MNDFDLGLLSRKTFAALSPADLQSLGKRASLSYLSGEGSLNDSIIKIAREYPSISHHQVQRVVEFANQETFSRLFSNNEKYAQDKNIDFDVADPGVILRELDSSARPAAMSVPPDEYSYSPVKLAHSAVEADMAVAKMFGFNPELPGSASSGSYSKTKTAEEVVGRVLPQAGGDFLDRIMSVGMDKHADIPGMVPQAIPQAMPAQGQGQDPGSDAGGDTHNEQMLNLQREIELAKKRQELQKVEQQTLDGMNPQGQPGAVPAPGPSAPTDQGVAAPDAGMAAAPTEQPAGPVESAPMPQEQQIPPPAEGAITAPPGSGTKMGSLTKQAMEYIKSDRPQSDLLLKAAALSVSLDKIKQAASSKGDYPMANPYGEVIRAKQKIARLLEDATYALGKNSELHKEATARFQREVAQHLWNGGNLAEVAQLMTAVHGEPVSVKIALASAMEELVRQGIDTSKAQAEAIKYEMEKSASTRTPNLKHPIAEAYSDLSKLAEGDQVLGEVRTQLYRQYQVVEKALQEGMLNASSI
jgi:hypothetical protein